MAWSVSDESAFEGVLDASVSMKRNYFHQSVKRKSRKSIKLLNDYSAEDDLCSFSSFSLISSFSYNSSIFPSKKGISILLFGFLCSAV